MVKKLELAVFLRFTSKPQLTSPTLLSLYGEKNHLTFLPFQLRPIGTGSQTGFAQLGLITKPSPGELSLRGPSDWRSVGFPNSIVKDVLRST
jgi:hypothetical protein